VQRRLFLPLLVLLTASLTLPATAQINPFRGSRGTPLNSDDLNALFHATTRLLDRPQLSVGTTEQWTNSASGVSGTVTAGDAVERRGLSCRLATYVLTGPAAERPRNGTLTWCKTQDGWKTAPG